MAVVWCNGGCVVIDIWIVKMIVMLMVKRMGMNDEMPVMISGLEQQHGMRKLLLTLRFSSGFSFVSFRFVSYY